MWFLLVLTFILICFFFYQVEYVENFTSIYKCPKLRFGNMYQSVLDLFSINRIKSIDKCDIYMPCGYNNVENELRNLKLYKKSQKIYGISGCDSIVSKNGLWNILENYYGRKNARLLMPESFVLDNPKNMKLFINNFNPKNLYLLKKNIQRKLGISLSRDLDYILSQRNTNFRVVQTYVKNLFLIKKRKVNLRLYLLIVCKKGKIYAYLHKLGKCIYTNKDIDSQLDNPLDPEKHLTSLNLKKSVYKNRPETLSDLKNYLGERNFNILFSNIYKNLTSVVKASKGKLCKLSGLKKHVSFQLFGIDYLFTKDMFPYLLEMNKGPDMSSKSETDTLTKQKVLGDVFITVGVSNGDSSLFQPLDI